MNAQQGWRSTGSGGGGATPPLDEVLAVGNSTGGSNISIDATQNITYNDGDGGILVSANTTAPQTWTLPDASGTIALLTDIPVITDDIIPRGTGAGIEDGTWSNVANDIYPEVDGSNIGSATNGIGTIFMASTIDYRSNLAFVNTASTHMTLTTSGSLGVNVVPLASVLTHFRGTGASSATTSLLVDNMAGTPSITVTDDNRTVMNGHVSIGVGSTTSGTTVLRVTETQTTAGGVLGTQSFLTVTPALSGVYSGTGSQNAVAIAGTLYAAGSTMRGAQNTVLPLGGGAKGSVSLDAIATDNTIFNTVGSVTTLNDVYGTRTTIGLPLFGAGTMTVINAYNNFVADGSAGFSATNTYGLYISALTRGTSNYGVISLTPRNGMGTATPAVSSILDLSSTTKGFLSPRMTSAQRVAIAAPATGLWVYQTDATAGFYYFDGTVWVFHDSRNIYNTSATLQAAREVTLGAFNLNFAVTAPLTGKFSVGGAAFAATHAIHLKAVDTGGTKIEGVNGTFNNVALVVSGGGASVIAQTSYNNADTELGFTGALAGTATTGRGRVRIGTGTQTSDAKFIVQGIDTTIGRPTVQFQGSGGLIGFQMQNSRNIGMGAVGTSAQRILMRGFGATSATSALTVQNSSASLALNVRDDRLIQIQTTASSTVFTSTVTNFISVASYTNTVTQAAHAFDVTINPSANNTAFTRNNSSRINKVGANSSGTLICVSGESRNSGAGAVTTMYGLDGLVFITSTGNVTNAFGISTNAQVSSASTITDFGGIEVRLEQSAAAATITNMYGILVNTPLNTGATVTNTYGLRINSNGSGTNNFGVFQAGSSLINAFGGEMTIGATTQSANASQLEVTGDIEILGGANSLILEDRTLGTRYEVYMDNGTLTSAPL